MNVKSILTNEKTYNFAKGAAGAIYATTALKAIGRPAFIYADKKSDAETKKYTAAKEFLYQALCLGITVAILPFFKIGGLKLAKKHLKDVPGFENFKIGKKGLEDFEEKVKDATLFNREKYTAEQIKSMKLANGGVELGSFVGSILGLTIVAPLVSHEILHPIMHMLGLEKKHDKNVGQPTEIFLADRKNPAEKENKISLNA